MSIKYDNYIRDHKENLIEPEVDIEKDTYRSYGRNYSPKKETND